MSIDIYPFNETSQASTLQQRANESSPDSNGAHGVGKVYLVGAGPGDPDLITVKGLRYLRRADVVIYDRLIALELLEEIRPEAERIFAGKGPKKHTLPQEEINALLVDRARKGLMVVRLKGGDPFVFGRGGEEALALAETGLPFEIVPGISSALAVPAYAGIPVTHRDHTPLLTIITGHEKRKEDPSTIDWQVLAQLGKLGGTLVILMGVATLPKIAAHLAENGLSTETPVAVIQQGTVNCQRTAVGTLETIAEKVVEAGLTSPAVIVIGSVVSLSNSLSWFEQTLAEQGMHAMGKAIGFGD